MCVVRAPEAKGQLGRFRRRWMGDIKMCVRAQDVNMWTELIWLRTATSGWLL
jgi:hypothetical protein